MSAKAPPPEQTSREGPRRRASAWPFVLAVGGVGVVVGLVASVAWLGGDPSPAHDGGRWAATVEGLCTAARAAQNGDADEARRVFLDEAHDPLHRLADQTAEQDRAPAARLLEAKERVEADLEGSQSSLERDLERLAEATRVAIRAAGDPVPARCPDPDR
ncbi:MAG: hypothetical protein ACRDZ1_08725 [Acidimicrobiia bacterium]